MRKVTKFALIAAALLVLLVGAAAVILPMVIDPNNYKGVIASAVRDKTGRELVFEGDMTLSVFPWLGVEVGPVRLSDSPDFGGGDFVRIQGAEVKVKLLPLLSKEFVVRTVVLDGLALKLVRDKKGVGNWEDLAGKAAQEAQGQVKEKDIKEASPEKMALPMILIGAVNVTDSTVVFDDRQAGTVYRVTALNLNTGQLALDDPATFTAVSFGCNLESSKPDLKAQVKLDSEANVVEQTKTFTMRIRSLAVQAQGAPVPGGKGDVVLSGTLKVDMAKQVVAVSGLALTGTSQLPTGPAQAAVNGDVRLDLGAQLLTVDGLALKASAQGAPLPGPTTAQVGGDLRYDLAKQALAVAGLALDLDSEGTGLPGGKAHAALRGDVAYDVAAGAASVKGLKVSAYQAEITGDVALSGLPDNPRFKGSLKIDGANPRQIMQALAMQVPATTDPNVLSSLALDTAFEGTPTSLRLPRLTLTLDQTTLKGSADVADFTRPDATFSLEADQLDLDRYLPPKKEEAPDAAKEEKKAEPGKEEGGLTKEQIRAMRLDGSIKVGDLKAMNLRTRDILLRIKARDGLITLDPLQAWLYGGKYLTTASYDARGAEVLSKLDLSLAGLALGGLVKDLAGKDIISGVTNLKINAAATGGDWKAISRTLDGAASFAIRDGALHGFQIVPNEARQKLEGGQAAKLDEAAKRQEFREIKADFVIKDGLASTDNLAYVSKHLNAQGSGGVNLAANEMDFLAKVDIPALPMLPVRAKGPLTAPSYGLDAAEFAKGLAKGIIKAPLDVGKGVIEGGAGVLKGIGEGLGGLFGGQKKKE